MPVDQQTTATPTQPNANLSLGNGCQGKISGHSHTHDDLGLPGDGNDWADLFGSAWDYSPNGTFSDLPNATGTSDLMTQLGMDPLSSILEDNFKAPPTTTTTGTTTAALNKTLNQAMRPNAAYGMTPQTRVDRSPAKPSQPNLYEALKRAQMMGSHAATTMYHMSPYQAAASGLVPMDWSTLMGSTEGSPILAGAGRMLPGGGSPQMAGQPMMLVPANRFKRPRMSPFLGEGIMGGGGMPFMQAASAFGMPGTAMSGWPMRFPMQRPAKVPLSPVGRTNVPGQSTLETGKAGDKTMPLVLPSQVKKETTLLFGAGNTIKTKDKIQETLKSFLLATRNLEYDNITVAELKRILRQFDLNATGKKAELIQRISNIREDYRQMEEEMIKSGEMDGNPSDNNSDTHGNKGDRGTLLKSGETYDRPSAEAAAVSPEETDPVSSPATMASEEGAGGFFGTTPTTSNVNEEKPPSAFSFDTKADDLDSLFDFGGNGQGFVDFC